MDSMKKISKHILDKTFKECYSELLKNPYAIDVKEHYAKVIHVYMTETMKEFPQFLRPYFNSSDWKWNVRLDDGAYYDANLVDHALSIIATLCNETAFEFIQSISFRDYDTRQREKWNGYHRALNQNTEMKSKLKTQQEIIEKLEAFVVNYDKLAFPKSARSELLRDVKKLKESLK